MGDAVSELSGKLGLDTTDFKTAIAGANRELRVIESGFRASAASLGDWSKDASGLELRIKSLGQAMDVQKSKVGALQGEYERISAEKGKTSRAAQDLLIKLNKETETLGKMQNELSQSEKALDGMGKESDQAGKELAEMGTKADAAGGKLNTLKTIAGGLGGALKVGAKAVAGLAVAAAGVGTAVTGLVLGSADAAGELVDMSTKAGISTTKLQELAYVGEQVGTDVETMTGTFGKLTKSMATAAEQQAAFDEALASGKMEDEITTPIGMAAAFNQLGVSFTDANGALRDTEDVFGDAINALGGVANETERDALAMEIFGKSAMELNPLIKAGADEIAALTEEAHEMGAVMAEEDVAGLESFGDEVASLKSGLKGTMGTLAAAFLPGFQDIAGGAKKYLGQFSDIVSGADGDLGKMADGVGGLLGQIVTDIAAQGPKMLEAGLGILQGIINALVTNLPVMLPAIIQMLTSLVSFIVQNLPLLINAAVQILVALVNGLVTQLPMLIEAAVQMIVALANGLSAALPQLIPTIVAIIPQIVLTLIENLPLLISAALELILALATGLIGAIPVLIPYIPQIVVAIFDALIAALPMIGQAAMELILALVNGIVDNLPKITTAAGEIIQTIITKVKELIPTIITTGQNIIDGLKEGAVTAWQNFLSWFTGVIDLLPAVVKKILGISSPSKVFAGIGENMAAGLGVGFGRQFKGIERDINKAIGGLSGADLSLALSGAGSPALQPAAAPIYITVHTTKEREAYSYRNARNLGEMIRRNR